MKTPQIFETSLISKHPDLGLRVVTLPARSIPEFTDPSFKLDASSFQRVAFERLDIYGDEPVDIDAFKDRLQEMIVSGFEENDTAEWHGTDEGGGVATLPEQDSTLDVAVEAANLVEAMVYTEVIPFENSPLSAESLEKILKSAGGTGVGAYLGFVVSGGTPLALILVPAGMIVCGAAAGLGDGLYLKLRKWISGH